jgi:hypothetical protein
MSAKNTFLALFILAATAAKAPQKPILVPVTLVFCHCEELAP